MKVLVTGGAGYIGSVIVFMLQNEGHEVTVLDNFSTGHRDALSPHTNILDVDLKDPRQLDEALKDRHYEAVIHMASLIVVSESVREPVKYYQNNVGATLNLLKALTTNPPKKLIFSSIIY